MASSGNFATMNPLHKTSNSVVYTQGNLKTSPSSNWSSTTWCFSNMVIPKDKKIYVEARLSSAAGVYASLAAATNLSTPGSSSVGGDGSVSLYDESKYVNGTRSASWITSASAGDILQLAIDGSNNKVWLGYNNTWGGSGNPSAGSNEAGTINTSTALGYDIFIACTQNSVSTMTFNFGQDSTFGGEVTAGGNADGNGFGDFKYAPPTGFLALCSGNLSVSDDIDPAQTDDDYPAKNFNVVTYTGDASTSNPVTGLGFQPDMVWIKSRGTTNLYSNAIFDSSRGRAKIVFSDSDRDEDTATSTQDLVSFDSDGFTVGTVYNSGSNINNDPIVAWCWKANGGTTASNGSGSITSTVQANTKSGFSIMTYTGNGSAGATIGHGLSAKPDLIFTKRRSSNQTWGVYHSALGATKYLALNSNAAAGTSTLFWNDTEPTDSLITFGTEGRVNQSSGTYVAYAWHNVEGYSKFGSYEGNADNDGTFVYTGFRPRMLWIKEADNADDWVVYDTARDTFNSGSSKVLRYETYVAEYDNASRAIDMLSNGFKIRTSNNTINQSSTFVYGCFGDVPFKYNNTF